jgi:IclR family transcriptional regulator, KDG regulon repressor
VKNYNNTAQSVERAFSVLDVLKDSDSALSVSDIARALKLTPPTVHRFLTTLMKCRVVEQDPQTRRYSLGLELLLYSKAVLDRFNWRSRAHPFLGELSREVGETVFMGILDEGAVVYIDHVDSLDHALRMPPQIGRRQEAHCTSMGKVLLAHVEPARLKEILQRAGLPKKTRNTITKIRTFRKALEHIRSSGYAVDQQEAEVGVCCVAAPITGISGETIAAISISGPSERLEQKGLETRLRAAVQATAARISQAISPSTGANR